MALIPENTIDEILGRIDIVELIAGYIPLKRIGANYKALCPFHHEKTPSFIVSSQRQIFHCFGCQAGGNAIGFLMQHERLDFPEALEILAKKANVVIQKIDSPKTAGYSKEKNLELYKINELAANYYFNQLSTQEGAVAYSYLNKRGITNQTVGKFRIGYAPDKWDGLLSYLRSKSVPLSLIEKAGLIIPKEGTGYYDRFRKRIIVPIIDTKNRVIAFGARVLDDSLPKYVNSPETQVYSKGRNLFGLDISKDPIRNNDLAIIVEGYFDLIMPYQAGVENIVASCGTALTIEQIRLLKRYTHNVVMVYDSDDAGQMATARSLGLLIEEDLSVKVAYLPKGYDPDTYLRKFGLEGFYNLIKEAKDIVDYKLCTLKSKYNFNSITDKAKVVSEILPLISKFNNAVIKSECIKKLSEELRVDENSLLVELKKIKDMPSDKKAVDKHVVLDKPLSRSLSTERLIVKMMLEEDGLIESLKDRLKPADFQDKHLSQIVERIYDLTSQGRKIEPKGLINYFPDRQITNIICELSTYEVPSVKDKDKVLSECVDRLQEYRRKIKQEAVHEEIKLAQIQKNESRLKELLKEFQSLAKKGAMKNE